LLSAALALFYQGDVSDLVSWVKDHNWATVIGYRTIEFNVFDIDKSDPWRHKWVPDLGRIPTRKASVGSGCSVNEGGQRVNCR
jgi:hypothetical protein